MRLPFLRSKSPSPGAWAQPSVPADAVALDAARVQARRRLIGALVLLAVAVVGFPLLFETQPRPSGKNLPIETGRVVLQSETTKQSSADAAAAAAPEAASTASTAAAAPAAPAATPAVGAVLAAPSTAAAVLATKEAPPKEAPPKAVVPKATPVLVDAPVAIDAGGARHVVQVGAYNDMQRMKQARDKAEKLGFKTYTSEVDTPSGRRTRVRLGPFPTREQAQAAAAKVKAAGMDANVLTL